MASKFKALYNIVYIYIVTGSHVELDGVRDAIECNQNMDSSAVVFLDELLPRTRSSAIQCQHRYAAWISKDSLLGVVWYV